MNDFSFLQNETARIVFVDENQATIERMLDYAPAMVEKLSLKDFTELMIYPFDEEAEMKGWHGTDFQNVLEDIWNTNQRSCTLAPREHLKTSSVLNYLVKLLYCRKYPIEIDYFHLVEEVAVEKFRKLKRIIERNPILSERLNIKEAQNWKDDLIVLSDGTTITPHAYNSGSVGKHPHIIVLDDVIDQSIIYSDNKNQKAISKFYSDIFPMISKEEPDKKIIIVGTAQRKDDLYARLPANFHKEVFQAILSDEDKQVLSPELFTYEALMLIKASISSEFGEKYWLKEYMNMPFEALGLIIKPEYIQEYTEEPAILASRLRLSIYQGWDLSVGKNIEKGDWTAGATIGIDWTNYSKIIIYLLGMHRARINFNSRIEAVKSEYQDWHPLAVGVESVAFQYDTIQFLKDNTIINVVEVKKITNKVQSFQTELAPYFENMQVFVPAGMETLKTELLSLPVGNYDDQADAMVIAIKTALLTPLGGSLDTNSDSDKAKPLTSGILGRKW